MRYHVMSIRSYKNSSGAALVVALILLAAMTVIGIAGMSSSSLETKMVASQKQRNVNMAIAESGLVDVEQYLENDLGLKKSDLFTDDCDAANGKCFGSAASKCVGGLCFDGVYVKADVSNADCKLATSAAASKRDQLWQDQAIWADATKHGSRTVGTDNHNIKYIIEFLCFSAPDFYQSPESSDPIFRVSVLYEPSNQQPIMLQSTYSLNL